MKLLLCCALLVSAASLAYSDDRPKITGIDHVAFYTTAPGAVMPLYMNVLGLGSASTIEPGETMRFLVGTQWVGYSPAPDANSTNRMDHVAFRTNDCEAMRNYLAAKGIDVPSSLYTDKTGSRSFRIKDPEGHTIEFLQHSKGSYSTLVAMPSHPPGETVAAISRHIIHVGFVVRNRATEDHFYKDILGFHIYWQGGMQDEKTDWAAMQVPDGTDWLEYMLNASANPDQHTLGVMDHISLGVKDMKQTQALLEKRGWKPHGNERMQMGRDGKWQLNIYDPDYTRIELMELKPVEKPCCSEFTGPHPTE